MKEFRLQELSEIGKNVIIKLGDEPSIIKKGICPKVIQVDPLIVVFEITSRTMRRMIKPNDINTYIPKLLYMLKAVRDIDYLLFVDEESSRGKKNGIKSI